MICVISPKCSASSLSVGAVINSTVGVAVSAATGESWAQKPQAMCSDLVKLLWKLQGRLLFVFLQDTTSSVNFPSCRVLQRPDKSAVPKNRISLPGSLPCCAPPGVTSDVRSTTSSPSMPPSLTNTPAAFVSSCPNATFPGVQVLDTFDHFDQRCKERPTSLCLVNFV